MLTVGVTCYQTCVTNMVLSHKSLHTQWFQTTIIYSELYVETWSRLRRLSDSKLKFNLALSHTSFILLQTERLPTLNFSLVMAEMLEGKPNHSSALQVRASFISANKLLVQNKPMGKIQVNGKPPGSGWHQMVSYPTTPKGMNPPWQLLREIHFWGMM